MAGFGSAFLSAGRACEESKPGGQRKVCAQTGRAVQGGGGEGLWWGASGRSGPSMDLLVLGGSLAAFRLANAGLEILVPPPPSAQRNRWKWRNIWTSFVHSLLSGSAALLGWVKAAGRHRGLGALGPMAERASLTSSPLSGCPVAGYPSTRRWPKTSSTRTGPRHIV